MESQISQILTTSLSAVDIAGALGLTKASEVNPTLYSMLSRKLVQKSTDTRPMWSLVPDFATPIRTYLTGKTEVSTRDVARAVFGPTGSPKQINPILYAMESAGVVRKTSEPDGTKPRWTLV